MSNELTGTNLSIVFPNIVTPNIKGNGILIGIKKETEVTRAIQKIPFVSPYYSLNFLEIGVRYNNRNINIVGRRIKVLNIDGNNQQLLDDCYKYRH